jgi:hypothetical protein
MIAVYDLNPESIGSMVQVDLADLKSEPDSPVGNS